MLFKSMCEYQFQGAKALYGTEFKPNIIPKKQTTRWERMCSTPKAQQATGIYQDR